MKIILMSLKNTITLESEGEKKTLSLLQVTLFLMKKKITALSD